ncbi:hypothetical protein AB0442_38960 [Kitasatospora sp. NPDC085895]|uniref:hypothetical protein n=1 Tax=Kitasatospora sp. NPDC085895 TaxID=3155057 RepID=UPI00344DC77F
MTHPDNHRHRDIDGIELCDLCGVLIPEPEAYLYIVADSSATARDALEHGERLLTACSWDHLETLVIAYEQRPFDLEELWASILFETHRRLGPTTTEHLLHATGLTPHQLDRAHHWHLHRLLQHPGHQQNASAEDDTRKEEDQDSHGDDHTDQDGGRSGAA